MTNIRTLCSIIDFPVFFKIFDRLRIEKPDFMTKIKIIDGHLEDQS